MWFFNKQVQAKFKVCQSSPIHIQTKRSLSHIVQHGKFSYKALPKPAFSVASVDPDVSPSGTNTQIEADSTLKPQFIYKQM